MYVSVVNAIEACHWLQSFNDTVRDSLLKRKWPAKFPMFWILLVISFWCEVHWQRNSIRAHFLSLGHTFSRALHGRKGRQSKSNELGEAKDTVVFPSVFPFFLKIESRSVPVPNVNTCWCCWLADWFMLISKENHRKYWTSVSIAAISLTARSIGQSVVDTNHHSILTAYLKRKVEKESWSFWIRRVLLPCWWLAIRCYAQL